jgi:hypothetical protein
MTSYDPYSYGSVPLAAEPAPCEPSLAAHDSAAEACAVDEEAPCAPEPTAMTAPAATQALASPAAARPEVPAAVQKAARMRAVAPPRRSPSLLWIAAPLVTLGCGGAVSWWLWDGQHNPVLGGIAGAATLVASLFAGLLLRR